MIPTFLKVWSGKGRLYEGTGLYGSSNLRQVDLETGVLSRELTPGTLGRVAVLGSRVYQLMAGRPVLSMTWKALLP